MVLRRSQTLAAGSKQRYHLVSVASGALQASTLPRAPARRNRRNNTSMRTCARRLGIASTSAWSDFILAVGALHTSRSCNHINMRHNDYAQYNVRIHRNIPRLLLSACSVGTLASASAHRAATSNSGNTLHRVNGCGSIMTALLMQAQPWSRRVWIEEAIDNSS